MARASWGAGSRDQLLDLPVVPGKDPRAADPKLRLECDDAGAVDGRDVGRELAEPVAGGRDHGKRVRQGRHYASPSPRGRRRPVRSPAIRRRRNGTAVTEVLRSVSYGPWRHRTSNLGIKSPLLCQLS